MRGYVKKITQKIDKFSREQLSSLLEDMAGEIENYDSIMESLSAGIVIVDKDYKLIQNNRIAERRLNFTQHLDETVPGSVYLWEIIEDSDIADFIKNCAQKGTTNSAEDFSVVSENGSVRFLNIQINPLVKKCDMCGRVILIRDVTDKKNQDLLVHRMENMANLTNLAAGMAHDIKNPLGAISIHIQLVQKALQKARENNDKLPAKKFVEDHIDVVNEEIEHLNRLVMDFLFAVRPVNATLQLKNPALLIKNIAEFFTAEFNRFNVGVEVTSSTDQRIMLDEKLLREVIMNLSQNALSAIKSRFPECNIERKSEEQGAFLGLFKIDCSTDGIKYVIKISDNGCGMSNQTVSRIFEPYYTTKANGTGLGMTMVYKIVKEFSGEIQVESQEGRGTIFTLTFPLPQDNTKLLK